MTVVTATKPLQNIVSIRSLAGGMSFQLVHILKFPFWAIARGCGVLERTSTGGMRQVKLKEEYEKSSKTHSTLPTTAQVTSEVASAGFSQRFAPACEQLGSLLRFCVAVARDARIWWMVSKAARLKDVDDGDVDDGIEERLDMETGYCRRDMAAIIEGDCGLCACADGGMVPNAN